MAETVAVVEFGYDARQRLTAESRVEDSVTIYDLSYTYDGLGNRQRKFDAVTRMGTYYEYDSGIGKGEIGKGDGSEKGMSPIIEGRRRISAKNK